MQVSDAVMVIGAGPAGLASAHYLEAANIPYLVIDRATMIGSTWAGLYPSLRLNTAGFVSHLPGARIPWRYGFYPLGRDYYAYLSRYAARRRFNIRLGVEVKRVSPDVTEDGRPCWRVETSEGVSYHPAVIIATGRFSNPYLPHIPGMETFEGELLHASGYHGPQPFAGKRVLVVGNGPSGGDIAVELAGTARAPVLLSIRSDVVLGRFYPLGIPQTIWAAIIALLPKRLQKPMINRILYMGYPGMHKLGLPLAPNREDRIGTSAPLRGADLVRVIRQGQVQAAAGLARLFGRCAELSDGTQHEIDAVILSTGYRPKLDYLDIAYETDADGWPLRTADDSQAIAGHPGLYLVGRYYRGLGPLYNIRREAALAVKQIDEQLGG